MENDRILIVFADAPNGYWKAMKQTKTIFVRCYKFYQKLIFVLFYTFIHFAWDEWFMTWVTVRYFEFYTLVDLQTLIIDCPMGVGL